MPRVFILLAITMVFISYQNFTSVDSNEWDSTSALKIIQEMNQFEKNDRPAPDTFATPQGGSDLKSVQNNWMQRQGSLFLNGYDKKLERAMNDRLNTWLQILSDDEDKEAPSPAVASGNKKITSASSSKSVSERPKRKQYLQFTKVNSLTYKVGESALDLTADPGNTRVNYSQSLFINTKLGLEHKTADNQTQMFLKYEW